LSRVDSYRDLHDQERKLKWFPDHPFFDRHKAAFRRDTLSFRAKDKINHCSY